MNHPEYLAACRGWYKRHAVLLGFDDETAEAMAYSAALNGFGLVAPETACAAEAGMEIPDIALRGVQDL